MTILIDDVPYTVERIPFSWLRVGSTVKLKRAPTAYDLKVLLIHRREQKAAVFYPNGSGFWVSFGDLVAS